MPVLTDLVRPEQISGLLLDRAPKLLNDPAKKPELDAVIEGIVSEVAYVVGNPPPPEKESRAAWCIALGVAAAIESSALPNQQLGGESRAEILRTKYLAVKAELAGAGTSGAGVPTPLGSFPSRQGWPEPAQPQELIWRR